MRILVSSGRGPAECRIAVKKIIERIHKEATKVDVEISEAPGPEHKRGFGPASVVLMLEGEGAEALGRSWLGTVQWIAQSTVRENHKRKNWFVSISEVGELPSKMTVRPEDVRFETFRAGGPGGQHQNTTDSAVRAIHGPSGLRVVARDGRSQHRNKEIALKRLAEMLDIQAAMANGALKEEIQAKHDDLERGNPSRVIRG